MPKLNKTGPEGNGGKTGRGLGKCNSQSNSFLLENLGTGMGMRRKSGCGEGKKRRLKSGKQLQ